MKTDRIPGRPEPGEAAPYYFTYIDRVTSDDVTAVLTAQLEEALAFLLEISEQRSLHHYAPEKWSVREVLNHVNDAERVFVLRALWFARGFDTPLPSFDEKVSASAAGADGFSWASHLEEFRGVRSATLAFFRHLRVEAWTRAGVASGNRVTVRALAYIVAGHLDHHLAVLRDRYR